MKRLSFVQLMAVLDVERFSDAWLASDELREHLNEMVSGCSEKFAKAFITKRMAKYRVLSVEKCKIAFNEECRLLRLRAEMATKRLAPGEMRRNMEEVLYRWENGYYDGEIYYDGGIEQLRRDIESGKFD